MGQPLWILQGLQSRDHLGRTYQRLEEPWTTEVPLVIFYGHGILDGLLLVARKGLWRAIIARNILSTHLQCTLRQLAQMQTQLHLDQKRACTSSSNSRCNQALRYHEIAMAATNPIFHLFRGVSILKTKWSRVKCCAFCIYIYILRKPADRLGLSF